MPPRIFSHLTGLADAKSGTHTVGGAGDLPRCSFYAAQPRPVRKVGGQQGNIGLGQCNAMPASTVYTSDISSDDMTTVERKEWARVAKHRPACLPACLPRALLSDLVM